MTVILSVLPLALTGSAFTIDFLATCEAEQQTNDRKQAAPKKTEAPTEASLDPDDLGAATSGTDRYRCIIGQLLHGNVYGLHNRLWRL